MLLLVISKYRIVLGGSNMFPGTDVRIEWGEECRGWRYQAKVKNGLVKTRLGRADWNRKL